MLVPLLYLFIKRITPLKDLVTKHVSMRTLLTWHIYAGVIGPILVLIHTGHKFESHLGIALTAMTLIVVFSGFTGRYLLSWISEEVKEKQAMLDQLNVAYQQTVVELREYPKEAIEVRSLGGLFQQLAARLFFLVQPVETPALAVTSRAVRLSESIADLEYAIRTHGTFKHAFSVWLKLHIVLSFTLYALLVLHVWAAIHFGLRWFS